jgi:hypothetical protein
MVRATAAEVIKLNGGNYLAGWDATSVGNLCAIVEEELDEYEIAATGSGPVTLANMLVHRRMINANWAAGPMTAPEPVVWTKDLIELKNRLQSEGTYIYATTVDMVSDED